MLVRLILHMLQLAAFSVVGAAFKRSADFHINDIASWFISVVKGLFGGVFGFFGGRQQEEMAA